MSCKSFIVALGGILAAAPAVASQTPVAEGAPPASETALYCLRMEPITGTRIGTVMCQTREQWYQDEVDLDAEWAKEGVRVIG